MKAQKVLLLLTVIAAGFAVNASAAMYKWTDKDGNIQYTETPPPEGNATEIATPPHVPAPPIKKESTGSDGGEDKKAGADAPLTPEQQENYRINCEAAKGNLEKYQTAHRIQQPNGEVVVLDDEIRQQKMQQAEEQIKKFCK